MTPWPRKRERYDIATAISATRGVELSHQQRPDVVFLSINMPGVDGLTVLTFLRKVDPVVPVIIVTGNRLIPIAARVVKAGAFGYVALQPRLHGTSGSGGDRRFVMLGLKRLSAPELAAG